MEVSIFLAKFWGWSLIIFFLIVSFNPRRTTQLFNDLKDEKFLILSSFLFILMGLLNILFHSIWEANWKIMITLMGWMLLCMGLSLFMMPNRTITCLEMINIKFVQVIYTLLLLVGIFLLNMAYSIVVFKNY